VLLQFCPSRNWNSENIAPCCGHLTITTSADMQKMQKSISDVRKHTGLFTPKYVIMVSGRRDPSWRPAFSASTAKPHVQWGGDTEFHIRHTLNLRQPQTYTNSSNQVNCTGSPLHSWYSTDQENLIM
jgi:hypothetical protein